MQPDTPPKMVSGLRRVGRHMAVLLCFAALTVLMTWPLVQHLATHVVKAKWFYDSMVNMQILGSRVHYAMGMSPSLKSVYDDYFMAPTPFSIANNENLFGLALVYAPFYLATGDPLLAYNLLLLCCICLSGYCTYLLVEELTESALAGILSGVAFAFCPYVFFELGRIQLVAAHLVPLFALFLHRSVTTWRMRDLVALGLTFAMQVGTCLYYAVFLGVYALFVGTWLVLLHRPEPRALLLKLSVAAALTALPVVGMVYPYFRARQDFPLTRSEYITAQYSGRIADFKKVYSENKTLTFLRDNALGPTEPIAFPGFTLLFLASFAIVVPLAGSLRRASSDVRITHLWRLAIALALALTSGGISLALRDLTPGLLGFLIAIVFFRSNRSQSLIPPMTFIYLCLLLLSLLLFLGPAPFALHGEQLKGPYQYLYQHVPGLDGIRYVSRFAILIMLSLAVLGGYGAARLLRGPTIGRLLGFALLLGAMLFELRNAPVTLAQIPSLSNIPPAVEWLSKHAGPEPIATVPAYTLGFFGARNDYMALFHRRRTVDGKSSWMPPVTYAYIYETRRFPRRTLSRLMQTLKVKYLLVNMAEFRSLDRGRRILQWLDNRPEVYVRRFVGDTDAVYEVRPSTDPSVSLLATPRFPASAKPIARHELHAHASILDGAALAALDANPFSRWRTPGEQRPGDWFEVGWGRERTIVGFELRRFADAFDAPGAFSVSVAGPDGQYRKVLTRPELRFYSDQVYHPKSFVFRIALPEPVRTSWIRIELLDGVAGHHWSIHETAVWALD